MAHKQETRGAAGRTRASVGIVLANTHEVTPPASALQVSRLCRQFQISAALAATVAELAYQSGRQA